MIVTEVPWDDEDAAALRAAMADEMRQLYGDRIDHDNGLPAGFSVLDGTAVYTGVAIIDGTPAGHVALRWVGSVEEGDLEVKLLYVTPEARGTGAAMALLDTAEHVARAHGAARLVLQTGDRQPAAVRLYENAGYQPIPVFPPYDEIWFSLCFAKPISR